jgi:hypothetical protein
MTSRPPTFEVLVALLGWRPHSKSSLQPDLLVIRTADYDPAVLTPFLLLAVEVLSPSTRRKDRLVKRSAYEQGRVRSSWIVDPAETSILALDLVDGRYEVAGEAHGDEPLTLERPFPVTLVPSDLGSGRPSRVSAGRSVPSVRPSAGRGRPGAARRRHRDARR